MDVASGGQPGPGWKNNGTVKMNKRRKSMRIRLYLTKHCLSPNYTRDVRDCIPAFRRS
jgi:hypothetical protein